MPEANWTKEIGVTGLSSWGGRITEDFLSEMRGANGYKRFNEMRLNSPIVGGMLSAITLSIRGVKWSYTSKLGEGDPRLTLIADSQSALEHSMNDFISEVLSMLWAGFSLFEVVYQRDKGGRLLWKKFAPRGQDTVTRWDMDNTGALKGFSQSAYPTYSTNFIPVEKLLHFRMMSERGNPEGRSILRTAWIPYYFCKNIQQIEAIGVERDLAGLPEIDLPANASTDENDSSSDAYKAAKMVRNIRNDEQAGIVLPPGWAFHLVSTGGSRQFDTDKIVTRYESRMLMAALAQFMLLGQQSVGSLALSRDQTSFFTMSVNAVADIIAETMTQQAIRRLLELNGQDSAGVKMEHSPAGDTDLTALTDFLSKAAPYLTWTPDDEAWLRQVGKLPERHAQDIAAEKEARDAKASAIAQAQAGATQGGKGEPESGSLVEMRSEFQSVLQQLREATTQQFKAPPPPQPVAESPGFQGMRRKFEDAMLEFRTALRSQPIRHATVEKSVSQPVVVSPPNVNVSITQPPDHIYITNKQDTQPLPQPAAPPVVNVSVEPAPVNNKFEVSPTPVTIQAVAAAPTINVSVEPTPVTIENTVNVPEQPVTLTMQGTTSVVRRDEQGRIAQIESEPDAG